MIGTNENISPEVGEFIAYPWQVPVWRDRSPTILLTGSAGGGKSRVIAEKLHAFCLKFPNSTALALRKTRESMTNSTVLFIERTVMKDQRHLVRHFPSKKRFEYYNGSILAYGGMKNEEQREQIRSIGQDGSVDIAWMEEAIAFSEDDYDELGARMRGIAASWNQIILTTNPASEFHWINKRLILGKECPVYYSSADMNPANPDHYIVRLANMPGILGKRLRDGLWISAEGVVYDNFDHNNILDIDWTPELDEYGYPIYEVEIGYDDGYTNPRAILFIQRVGSQIIVFDEIYQSQELPEATIKRILKRMVEYFGAVAQDDGEPLLNESGDEVPLVLPAIAVGDPSAAVLRKRFRLANIPTRRPGMKAVNDGVDLVRELICNESGVRTIIIHPRCKNLISEISEGYRYPDPSKRNNENPVDENGHACDGLRYWASARSRIS